MACTRNTISTASTTGKPRAIERMTEASSTKRRMGSSTLIRNRTPSVKPVIASTRAAYPIRLFQLSLIGQIVPLRCSETRTLSVLTDDGRARRLFGCDQRDGPSPGRHVRLRIKADRHAMDFVSPDVPDANPAAAIAQFGTNHGQMTRHLLGGELRAGPALEQHPTGIENDVTVVEKIEKEARH